MSFSWFFIISICCLCSFINETAQEVAPSKVNAKLAPNDIWPVRPAIAGPEFNAAFVRLHLILNFSFDLSLHRVSESLLYFYIISPPFFLKISLPVECRAISPIEENKASLRVAFSPHAEDLSFIVWFMSNESNSASSINSS